MKTVKDLLDCTASELVTIDASASVFSAIALMAEKQIGALVVHSDVSRLAGIITERDYARKIILNDKSSRDTRVSEIMTDNVVVVEESTPLPQCNMLISHNRIRHLPVVRQGVPVGLITVSDLLKAIIEEQTLTIEELESFMFEDRGGEG